MSAALLLVVMTTYSEPVYPHKTAVRDTNVVQITIKELRRRERASYAIGYTNALFTTVNALVGCRGDDTANAKKAEARTAKTPRLSLRARRAMAMRPASTNLSETVVATTNTVEGGTCCVQRPPDRLLRRKRKKAAKEGR